MSLDLMELVHEVGLREIAEEVGIVNPVGDNNPNSSAHHNPASAATSAASQKKQAVQPYVGPGPAVPESLSSTFSAAGGEPAAKKKRVQRAHGKGTDKGLRHFSMKVCEKVEQKGRTTYNEVADELVHDFVTTGGTFDPQNAIAPPDEDQVYDEKNIRRRVYDALNVLMAMDIITKEKKQILWKGLPTNPQQEGTRLELELNSRKERLDKKRLHLQELLTQKISFKNLIARNAAVAKAAGGDGTGSGAVTTSTAADEAVPPAGRIPLPFILVNSNKEAVIDCEMAEDKQEIFFNFSAPFEIHDDNETLKRMHMQFCHSVAAIKEMVPETLVQFTTTGQRQQQELEGITPKLDDEEVS